MNWLSQLRRSLAVLFRRDRFDRELAEEMQSHLEMQAEENRDAGMEAAAARYAASRQFGNATLLREHSMEAWGWRWLDGLARDARYASRTLRRSPAFACVAVLTLALALGANMALFTLIYRVVLRPLDYRDLDRLVDVHLILTEQRRGTIPMSWSYPKFENLTRENRSFDALTAFQARDFTISGIELPERLTGEIVSAHYFRITGVRPVLGRVFLDEEDAPGGKQPAILISNGLWSRAFGSSPGVINRNVRVDGVPMTIVGVLPSGFKGESGRADVWAPMATYFAGNRRPGRGSHNLEVIGQLKPGITTAQANEDVRALVARMEREIPTDRTGATRWSGGARPLLDARVDPVVRKALWILQAATLCVLLIGCVNLANLLLSRGIARRGELAVRLALGTSRGALLRQLLMEPVALAVVGGIAGLFLAQWGLRTLPILLPQAETSFWFDYTHLIDPEELRLHWPLVTVGVALSVFTGLACGLLPAWQATRTGAELALRSGLIRAHASHQRLRNVLVAAQMALALILLAGAGLMVRSFAARLAAKIGAETRHIITLRVQPATRDPIQFRAFYEELRRRAAALPGADVAAIANGLPVYGPDLGTSVHVEGKETPVDTGEYQVSPEYFRLFRIPLLAGRYFNEGDREGNPAVVVISERAARQFFPGKNPLGRRMDYPNKTGSVAEVIGVAADVKYTSPDGRDRAVTYCSTLQSRAGGFLAVRTAIDPTAFVAALREQVRQLDPEAPLYDVRTMEQQVAAGTWRSRLTSVLLSLMAILALLLAALGIYGVFSYMVAARTHDIGVRIALGARREAILLMVMRDAARLCVAALAVGLPAAFALTRVLASELYGVEPNDPLTFSAVAMLLVLVALVACYFPAARAMRVDPMEALREE
jgi:putative ABC transport system permease protein